MRVLLTLHGGEKALADVMNGLITRNVRSIQEGKVPNLDDVSLAYDEAPVWRDSLTALRTGKASAGTLAAWRAAEERAKGAKAVVALVSGVPQVAQRAAHRSCSTIRLCSSGGLPTTVLA